MNSEEKLVWLAAMLTELHIGATPSKASKIADQTLDAFLLRFGNLGEKESTAGDD